MPLTPRLMGLPWAAYGRDVPNNCTSITWEWDSYLGVGLKRLLFAHAGHVPFCTRPCAQVFEFYFRSYLSQWSQSVFSDALHSIPQVSWVLAYHGCHFP
jgi:hypothetical protein